MVSASRSSPKAFAMRGTLGAPLSLNASLRWGAVRPLLDALAPRSVLEIGCGQGGFGARIAARTEYVGLEPDEQSAQVATSRIAPLGGDVRHGSLDQLADDETFDMVCAFEVLEHIEDDRAAMASWVRRLRPGGSVLFSVPAWRHRFGPWDELAGHYRRYDPADVEELLAAVGCVDARHVLYGWPLGLLLERGRDAMAHRRLRTCPESMDGRTAESGRQLQPKGAIIGVPVSAATAAFIALQRMRPTIGPGLVAVAASAAQATNT